MSFLEQLKTVAAEAEVTLDRITNKNYGSERLQEAIRYSALNGGKRLRAYMVAEFCELCSHVTMHLGQRVLLRSSWWD